MPSEMYNENIYKLGRKTKADVTFSLVPPEAKEQAAVTLPEGNPISKHDQVVNNVTNISGRIATFEPNHWKLDGSFILPLLNVIGNDAAGAESNIETGWWSKQQSGADCTFATPLVIETVFTEARNVKRLGIAFDEPTDNYCSDLEFAAYNGNGQLVYNERIGSNSAAYAYTSKGADHVCRVVVTLYKTNRPYRYARVSELDFGVVIRFSNDDIKSLTAITESDPTGKAFPFSSFSLTVFNKGRFDIFDPDSFAQYLYLRQPMEYRHGLDIGNGSSVSQNETMEWAYGGAFYLRDWSVSDESVTFNCGGKTSLIDSYTFYNSSFEAVTVGHLIRRVLNEIHTKYRIDPVLDSTPLVTAYLGNVNFRGALSILSELSCALCYEDIRNELQFRDILETGSVMDDINYENAIKKPSSKMGDYYNGINLTEYYMSVEADKQLAKLELSVRGSRDITVYFTAPYPQNKIIPVCTLTEGFELSNAVFHTMYMTATLTGSGRAELIVTGSRVSFSSSQSFYPAPWKDPLEPEYPYAVDLPVMIHMPERNDFRDWFLERRFKLLQKRLTTDINWLQNPAIELGQTVNVQLNKQGYSRDMFVTKQIISFDGGALRGSTKLLSEI